MSADTYLQSRGTEFMGAGELKRYTFVVQVHPDGVSTLENLSTQERIKVSELASVGQQIKRWLAEVDGDLGSSDVSPASSSAPAQHGSGPE